MSKIIEFNYAEQYPQVISADSNTIDNVLRDQEIEYRQPSISDIEYAIEWLALYEIVDYTDWENPNEDPHLQAFANVIAFLNSQIHTKARRTAINNMKRAYAEEHGVPIKQLRIKKGA